MSVQALAPPAAYAARLPPREVAGTAFQGLRTRRLRAALSALGIAIGIGAMVAVVGVSASAQANLLALIDRLGTNLLTVTPGTNFLGQNASLPSTSAGMVAHMLRVDDAAAIYPIGDTNVYRTPFVPTEQTGGIGVDAASDQLPSVLGATMGAGHFLDAVSDRVPEAVLGADAAKTLEISRVGAHVMVYAGNHWFTVIGIMRSAQLDTNLDSAVFVSLPMARKLLGASANPSEIYVRANPSDVTGVAGLLPATVDPQDPSGVNVGRPSDALEARAAAKGQFTDLLLGLGAVTLLVGAIGIANIMVISVLERRGEIGLRRALGATRPHISVQFLAESALLAVMGGVAGLVLGAGATFVYAASRSQPFVIPIYVLVAAPATGLAIGVIAGVYPALKAARLSPTEALRA